MYVMDFDGIYITLTTVKISFCCCIEFEFLTYDLKLNLYRRGYNYILYSICKLKHASAMG